jgi:hypothetical protein
MRSIFAVLKKRLLQLRIFRCVCDANVCKLQCSRAKYGSLVESFRPSAPRLGASRTVITPANSTSFRQLTQLTKLSNSHDNCKIAFLADLNCVPSSQILQGMCKEGNLEVGSPSHLTTCCNQRFKGCFDYVLLSSEGWTIQQNEENDINHADRAIPDQNEGSDHVPVIARCLI